MLIVNSFLCITLIAAAVVSAASVEALPDSASPAGIAARRSSGDRIVLTAKEIREMNVQSIPELLNRLPGITAGETYAKIQGATDVRVMLDGRPINSSSSGHGGIKWNMVSVRDIEKVVILMGGGAAAVGDGTSGGAILLTSKKNNGAHVGRKTAALLLRKAIVRGNDVSVNP
jgi:outer membrane receptor protein involved in Fe transport